jgi:hypothetical protein
MKRKFILFLATAMITCASSNIVISAAETQETEAPTWEAFKNLDDMKRIPGSDLIFKVLSDPLSEMGIKSLSKTVLGNFSEISDTTVSFGAECYIDDDSVLLVQFNYTESEDELIIDYIYDCDSQEYFYNSEDSDAKLSAPKNSSNSTSVSSKYTLEFGELLDANPSGGADGNTLVIKAKISSSYSNKATINQNYHNIIDLVENQGCGKYDAIDYWAVADMSDGSEGKVISFLVNKDVLDAIDNQSIVATTLDSYLEDLWILPSLLN